MFIFALVAEWNFGNIALREDFARCEEYRVRVEKINRQGRNIKMSHSFFIPTWVLFFLITSSLTIQIQFANGDIVEEKGRLRGRTGISPPAPATNPINHYFPPLKGPGCAPDTPAAPPGRINERKFK